MATLETGRRDTVGEGDVLHAEVGRRGIGGIEKGLNAGPRWPPPRMVSSGAAMYGGKPFSLDRSCRR